MVALLTHTCDSSHRTVLCTLSTALTELWVDNESAHCLTDFCTTLVVTDMFLVLIAEGLQSTEHRQRRTLTKSAQSHALNHLCQFLQTVQIFHFAFVIYDPFQDLQHSLCSFPTWNTFSTGLSLGKTHEETGNLYHTGIGIHNYHSTGSYDCIEFLYRVKIQRLIQMFLCQTSTGRSTDLNCFELSTIFETATNIKDDLAKGTSHRHLDQTCIFNRTCQREGFCSRASLGTDGTEPFCTFQNDLRYVGKRFYVVEDGRFLPQSFFYRSWRFDTRHTSFSFDGCRQSRSLTTYKSTCTTVDMQMEVHIRTKDMIT